MAKKKSAAKPTRLPATTSSVVKKQVLPEAIPQISEPKGNESKLVQSQPTQHDQSDRLTKLQIDLEFNKKLSITPTHSISISQSLEQQLVARAKSSATPQSAPTLESLTFTYLSLVKFGFSLSDVEQIMRMNYTVVDCLNWAFVNLPLNQIPALFTDKLHSNSEIKFVVSKANKVQNRKPEPTPIEPGILPEKKQVSLDSHLKQWVLDSVQDDDEPESVLPTNEEYAMLKLGLSEFPENRHRMDVLQLNRDFNPRLANEHLALLIRERDAALGKKKKKAKKPQQVEEEEIDIGGMFDQVDDPVQGKTSTVVIKDMSYDKWTGKSPKQYCMNVKGTRANFSLINDGKSGYRARVLLVGGAHAGLEIEMLEFERVLDQNQANHYVATKLLYHLVPSLPIYRSLPGPYRDLWLGMTHAVEKVKEDQVEAVDSARRFFLQGVLASYTKSESCTQDATVVDDDLQMKKSFKRKPLNMSVLSSQFTQTISSKEYNKMLESRKNLPIYAHKHAILSLIDSTSTTIISSSTGSGKSTQVPQYILESSLESKRPCFILCTQPRRISAISISTRVGDEICLKDIVSYSVRGESNQNPSTRLLYCTTGVALRMIQSRDISHITHIVIDEVHERSVEIDLLLLLCKRLCSNIKIILMSATAESALFEQYFDNARIITVEGRIHPVESFFLQDALSLTGYVKEDFRERGKYFKIGGRKEWVDDDEAQEEEDSRIDLELVEELVRFIHKNGSVDTPDEKGAILVFLPGFSEIKGLYDRLSFDASKRGVEGSVNQRAVFDPPTKGIRKIVLATNIAETGITIPDVTYVVDTCRANQISYDSHKHISRLSQVYISKAACIQRRGRAGRLRNGQCFHLISEARFEKLAQHQVAEIMRVPLEELVLLVSTSNLGPLRQVLAGAISPPPVRHVERSIQELITIGALDADTQLATSLGKVLVNFPVNARLGKMLLYSVALSCLDPILTIAAALSLDKSPFNRPLGRENEADLARNAFKSGIDSDLVMIATAFAEFRDVCLDKGQNTRKWCDSKFLSYANLILIEETRLQLLKLLISVKVVGKDVYSSSMVDSYYTENDSIPSAVLATIAASLYPNLLKVVPEGVEKRPHGLVLEMPGSSGLVQPHKKSAYSDLIPGKNSWFTYHSLSRVDSGNGSRLCVWDLTKISTMFAFLFSNRVEIDYRFGIATIQDGVVLSCPARTCFLLDLFRKRINELLDRGIAGDVFSRKEKEDVKVFFDLLRDDMARDAASVPGAGNG